MKLEPVWICYYKQLRLHRPTFYSASIRRHNWPGYFVFRAFPNRGDWCIEYLSRDLEDVKQKAEAWVGGEQPEGFYSTSY